LVWCLNNVLIVLYTILMFLWSSNISFTWPQKQILPYRILLFLSRNFDWILNFLYYLKHFIWIWCKKMHQRVPFPSRKQKNVLEFDLSVTMSVPCEPQLPSAILTKLFSTFYRELYLTQTTLTCATFIVLLNILFLGTSWSTKMKKKK
jgi:hypothetical protein